MQERSDKVTDLLGRHDLATAGKAQPHVAVVKYKYHILILYALIIHQAFDLLPQYKYPPYNSINMQFSLSFSLALLAAVPAVFAIPATNIYVVESGKQSPQKSLNTGIGPCLMLCSPEKLECREGMVRGLLVLQFSLQEEVTDMTRRARTNLA